MPQRGVRFHPIRSLVKYFTGLLAQNEVERRADQLLTEMLRICIGSKIDCIHFVRKYGEYVSANGGAVSTHNYTQFHRIDDEDYHALRVYLELDLNPSDREIREIQIGDTLITMTPELSRSCDREALHLHLVYSSPLTETSN